MYYTCLYYLLQPTTSDFYILKVYSRLLSTVAMFGFYSPEQYRDDSRYISPQGACPRPPPRKSKLIKSPGKYFCLMIKIDNTLQVFVIDE